MVHHPRAAANVAEYDDDDRAFESFSAPEYPDKTGRCKQADERKTVHRAHRQHFSTIPLSFWFLTSGTWRPGLTNFCCNDDLDGLHVVQIVGENADQRTEDDLLCIETMLEVDVFVPNEPASHSDSLDETDTTSVHGHERHQSHSIPQ